MLSGFKFAVSKKAKPLLVFCVLLLLPLILSNRASAEIGVYGQFFYNSDGTNATILNYAPWFDDSISVPDSINGVPVTRIADYAMFGVTSLTSISIPSSVVDVGKHAFGSCSKLTNVVFTGGVTNIGDCAFYGCGRLRSVVLPDTLSSIGTNVFYGCTSLIDVSVDPSNAKYSSVDGVLFNKNQTAMLFFPVAKGGSYVLPDTVTAVGTNAFQSCGNLVRITLGTGVSDIGTNAFYGCSNLSSVIIRGNLVSLSDFAFAICPKLNGIYFEGNTDPPPLLGQGVFLGNGHVTFYYPDGATGWATPYGLSGVSRKAVTGMCNDFLYLLRDNQATIVGYLGIESSVLIPPLIGDLPVVSIGSGAFSWCVGLTNIVIPDSVANIEDQAFRTCTSLATVSIGQGVTSIGTNVFTDCSKLTSLSIPDSVERIGAGAFTTCMNLVNVTIGKGLAVIGDSGFASCPSLTTILFQGDAPFLDGANVFSNDSQATVRFLPGARGWSSDFGGRPARMATGVYGDFVYESTGTNVAVVAYLGSSASIVIPEQIDELPVTRIGTNAFAYRSCITNVTLPDSVTMVENRAFCSCTNLLSFIAGPNLASIGDYAFNSCTKLGRVFLPGNAPVLGGTNVFTGATVTVYRLNSTTGWSTTFGGRPAKAIDAMFGDLSFTSDGTRITINGYTGTGGGIVIPDWINGLPVTVIAGNAFKNCANLTGVVVGTNVTSIGDYAFAYCPKISSAIIGNSVTNMGAYTFAECSSLSELSLGVRVGRIGSSAFSRCSSLTNLSIPDSVCSIDSGAFYYCSGLVYVTVGSGVTNIQDNAFASCLKLRALLYTGNRPKISSSAFSGAIYARTYALVGTTNWVTNIFSCRYASGISDDFVYLLNGSTSSIVGYLGDDRSLVVPNSLDGIPVSAISSYAFAYSQNLIKVTISEGISSIEPSAFAGCNILSISLPASLTNLASGAAGGPLFTVSPLNSNYCSVDGVLYDKSLQTLIRYPSQKSGNVVIPESVINIAPSAFVGCSGVTSLVMPKHVNQLGNYAFSGCAGLTNVLIPDTVTSLPDGLFSGCTNLMHLEIPNGVTNIGAVTFCRTSLTNIAIPNTVLSVGQYAFEGCPNLWNMFIPASVVAITVPAFSCPNLAKIEVDSANPCFCERDGVLFDKPGETLLEYPPAKTGDYRVPDGVSRILDYAFYGCTGLTNLTISSGVTNLGGSALFSCSNLAVVFFEGAPPILEGGYFSCENAALFHSPEVAGWTNTYGRHPISASRVSGDFLYASDGTTATITFYLGTDGHAIVPSHIDGVQVTNIAPSVFRQSQRIRSLVIPGTISTIGDQMFYQCSNLESVIINNGVTNIGEWAFAYTGLTNLITPESVVAIDKSAFQGCLKLSSLTIGDGVADIGADAFYGCTNLVNVAFGSSLTNLGNYAFGYCVSLSSLEIPQTVLALGDHCFELCRGLQSLTIPDSVTQIGSDAFAYCTSLSRVVLGKGLSRIGGSAFAYCTGLKDIVFKGNPPLLEGTPFYQNSQATVYHFREATGWDSSFGGLRTATLNLSPSIQAVGNVITVQWPQGTLLETTNLVEGPWLTNVATSPLSYTPEPAAPAKFYRVMF